MGIRCGADPLLLQLLLGFPDGLQVQPVELGQYVVDLRGGNAGFLHGAAQHLGDPIDAAKARVLGVALRMLI